VKSVTPLSVRFVVVDNEHLETVGVVNGAPEIAKKTVIEKTSPVVVQNSHSTYVDGEGFTKVLRKKKREQPGKENLKEVTNKLNIWYAVNEGQQIQKEKKSTGFEFINSKLSCLS
jgi:hypothetical protein